MDIYHKVLLKLYEETGGRDSRAVDLQDLVKKMGFPGHYADIAARLGGESWIAEDSKRNFVRITHWGAAEAKKSLSAAASAAAPAQAQKTGAKNPETCTKLAGELSELVKILSSDASAENISKTEKKLSELQKALAELKAA